MNVYLGELYKEVSYIQSSGTQYINTGYVPSNTTKIKISMGGWTYVQQYAHLFGVRAAWNTTDASVGRGFLLCNQYNTSYIGMFGKGYSNNSGGWSSTTFSFANGNNHIVEMSQSGAYEDGTLKASLQTVTFTSPSNMCIFALNDNGTVKENSSYKLYYFKIRDNGNLVRDFVPCYRVSDNVIGLFDKVENKFYTNAGTGSFTKGNDVKVFQPELKNAYIGQVYEYSYDFRNKSTSQIQSDGWSIVRNYIQLGSNGISGTTYNRGEIRKAIDLLGAKKCIFKTNLYINGGSGNRGYISPGFPNAQGSFRANGAGNYPGYGLQLNLASGTSRSQFDETITLNGQYTSILEVDLVNNKASITLDGVGTITNSNPDLSTFLDQQYISIKVENGNSRVKDISIIIEY